MFGMAPPSQENEVAARLTRTALHVLEVFSREIWLTKSENYYTNAGILLVKVVFLK